MTRFVIGMLAAGLWLAAVVAVFYLARNSPKRPSETIRAFRSTRRKLAPAGPQPRVVLVGAPDVEPDHHRAAGLWSSSSPLDRIDEFPAIQPEEQASPEFEPISRDAPIGDQPYDRVSARPRSRRGPRKIGRLTYVLVDEQGRPEIE